MKLHSGKDISEMIDEVKEEDVMEEDWPHGFDESTNLAANAKQLRLISHTPPVADHGSQPSRKKRNR